MSVEPLPPESFLRPARWPAGCGAAMTTRLGGEGVAPYATLNMRAHDDDPVDVATVERHRARHIAALGAVPVWLHQVHGARCVRVGRVDAESSESPHHADAAVTTERGVAVTVQVADCLPVLLADRAGRVVGAAHAGWRGLALGVVENTIACMREAAGVEPSDLVAWLGACIGPQRFEVGDDVRDAFVEAMGEGAATHFRVAPEVDGVRKWWADLPALAVERLVRAGVPHEAVEVAGRCTVTEADTFFSFRRERNTGRMAASAWRG